MINQRGLRVTLWPNEGLGLTKKYTNDEKNTFIIAFAAFALDGKSINYNREQWLHLLDIGYFNQEGKTGKQSQ